jgi:hypothetical protein
MSRDTSQKEQGDRRLWLSEPCPSCRAQAGARCQHRRPPGRKPAHTLTLHAARGWRQRSCSACKASPGEPCFTPRGRAAARPHTARLHPARGEMHAPEDVWRALERLGASGALVRFSGGGGRQATLENISIQADGRELAGWSGEGEGELAGALAGPVWGQYGSFRGQPRITATLTWKVADRSLILAGKRGSERFRETVQPPSKIATRAVRDVSRDTSLSAGSDRKRTPKAQWEPQLRARAGGPKTTGRVCRSCGQPIAANARPEACYCSKRCRQAASRARLREQSGRSALKPPERCAWCDGPMSTELRPEARYCSKRCRQAASRARLALTRRQGGATNAPASPELQLRLH